MFLHGGRVAVRRETDHHRIIPPHGGTAPHSFLIEIRRRRDAQRFTRELGEPEPVRRRGHGGLRLELVLRIRVILGDKHLQTDPQLAQVALADG